MNIMNTMNTLNREKCQKIVKNSEVFYCTNTKVEGFEVELYDYRLAKPSDFSENDAFELRGLTFIKDPKTNTWSRFLLMQKFFNLNETSHIIKNNKYSTLFEDLKDKKISSVQVKEDGSVIVPLRLPNNKVVFKSKMSFESSQAKMAQELYENNSKLNTFVNEMLDKNIVPIFELVSPANQIVLPYNNTELILLQLRCNVSGIYYKEEYIKNICLKYGVKVANYISIKSLEDLTQLQKTEKNCEGWVVTFEDGFMIKVKTDWYFQNHGLMTNTTKSNLLVECIINDNIDDVISIASGQKKEYIINVRNLVQADFNKNVSEFIKLRNEYFANYSENKKEFVLKYKENKLFHTIMKSLNDKEDTNIIAKKYISESMIYLNRSLKEANSYLISLGIKVI